MSGMRSDQARAPSYALLRPFRSAENVTSATFPVHHDLVDTLLRAHSTPSDPPRWDPIVAHVLATLAGYAYSDAETVAMIADPSGGMGSVGSSGSPLGGTQSARSLSAPIHPRFSAAAATAAQGTAVSIGQTAVAQTATAQSWTATPTPTP